MASDDIAVLGAANLQRRTQDGRGGAVKSRYTIKVTGDSLLINTDPKTLGKGPAEAIAEVLREKVRGITATVSASTSKGRASAAKAFAEGKSWAMRRYSGGKTGPMAPNQSDRMFNDSGRMAAKIVASARGEDWIVNMPANRLSPDTLNGGEGALVKIYRRLVELVPEFGDSRRLLESGHVVRALELGIKEAIQKADERTVELKKQLMTARINVVKQIVGALG